MLASKSIRSGALDEVKSLARDLSIQDPQRAAILSSIPDLSGFEIEIESILLAGSPFAKLFLLKKLSTYSSLECFSSLSLLPVLLSLLEDTTIIDDIGASFRIDNLAAVALVRLSKVEDIHIPDLQKWLDSRRTALSDQESNIHYWAVLLFAELGVPEALELLKKMALEDSGDPFKELTRYYIEFGARSAQFSGYAGRYDLHKP